MLYIELLKNTKVSQGRRSSLMTEEIRSHKEPGKGEAMEDSRWR